MVIVEKIINYERWIRNSLVFFDFVFWKNFNCVLSFYLDFIFMCLKLIIEIFICEMFVGEVKMDFENVVLKL